MTIDDIRSRSLALIREIRKAEAEIERMGKANNEACDRIQELETLNDALVKDLSFYRDEYQPVSAARDKAEARVRELEAQLAAVQPAPTAPTYAQIETLARAMDESWETVAGGEYFTGWHQQTDPHRERRRAQARAAYEHIGFGLTHCPNCGDRLHKAECDNCTAWALRWHELVAKHESELARVTAERDGWETDCKRETENVKYWREQLVTRPVKVMFNCTAKDVAWEFANTDWSEADIAIAQTCMDYLATHAVVEVPPGVPTLEDLAELIYIHVRTGRNYATSEPELKAAAAAIRDRVLAGLPTPEPAPAPLSVEGLRGILEDVCGVNTPLNECIIDVHDSDIPNIHAALLPYLREPVAWELDTPENGWLSDGFCIFNPATGESHSLDSFVSHVVSRIRPVFECQECAAAKRAVQIERDGVNALAARITAARAALEGEA